MLPWLLAPALATASLGAMAQVNGARFEGLPGDPFLHGATLDTRGPDWSATTIGSDPYEFFVTYKYAPAGFAPVFYSFSIDTGPGALVGVGPYRRGEGAPFGANVQTVNFGTNAFNSGCTGKATGGFVVLEYEPAPGSSGPPNRAAVDFDIACNGIPALHGEVRVNSTLPFTIDKPAGSATPDPFVFAPGTTPASGGTVVSGEITLLGSNSPSPISVTGGEYSVNGGAFTSVTGNMLPLDRIRVRATAAAGGGATATLGVSGFSTPFVVAAYSPGQPITAFHVEGDTTLGAWSPEWTVTPSRASLTSSLPNDLKFTTSPNGVPWSVTFFAPYGQALAAGPYETAVAATSSGDLPGFALTSGGVDCNPSTTRFVVLDVAYLTHYNNPRLASFAAAFDATCSGTLGHVYGEVRYNSVAPLTSLKPPGSTMPDAFAFRAVDLAAPATKVISNAVSVLGVNAPAPISIAGGLYRINGGPFTAEPGVVNAHDRIEVEVTASRTPGTTRTASLNIGGRAAPFSVKTFRNGDRATFLTFRSTGDYVGAGRTATFASPPYTVRQVTFNSGPFNTTSLVFHLTGADGEDWTFSYGTYRDTTSFQLSGDGRRCDSVAGTATISDLDYSPTTGEVYRFAADISQVCNGSGPPLVAEVRYNSTVPSMLLSDGSPIVPRQHAFDANNDGRADVLLRHTDGSQSAWLMPANLAFASSALLPAGTGWSAAMTGDFNGDGNSDIVWTHTDGRSAIWLMNGASQIGGGMLLPAGTGWTPLLVGDFNGDGKADIVWTHPDGRSAIWLMDGAMQVGGAILLSAGTGWTPKLLADFDGDGKADIVWEHTDGRSAIWMMSGATQVGGRVLFGAGTGWFTRLVADVDGNGKSDIVFTHTDGRTGIWLMNGIAQVGGAVIRPAGTAEVPVFARDIDGDGRDDIVWRTPAGVTSYWLMDGTASNAHSTFDGAAAGYVVQRVVDFNGDGLADFLTAHADGSVRIYTYDGGTFVAGAVQAPGAGWSVIPLRD